MKEFFIALFVLAYFVGLLLVVIFDCKIYRKDIVMWFKKIGKSVCGDGYSKAERELIEAEVQRRLENCAGKLELDALILWVLHEKCGFGPSRLKRFYEGYMPVMGVYLNDVRASSGMVGGPYDYVNKLAEYGIDVGEWFMSMAMYGEVHEGEELVKEIREEGKIE